MKNLKYFVMAILAISFAACDKNSNDPTNEQDDQIVTEDAVKVDGGYLLGDNGLYYELTSSNTVAVCKDVKENNYSHLLQSDLIIPERITCEGRTYSVTAVLEEALYYCKKIYSITFPSTMETIGENACACTSANTIVFKSTAPTFEGICCFYGGSAISTFKTIIIPCGTLDAYKAAFVKQKAYCIYNADAYYTDRYTYYYYDDEACNLTIDDECGNRWTSGSTNE